MKLSVEQSLENKEVEIIIKCSLIDDDLEKLITQIRLYAFSVVGRKDGSDYVLKLEDIYYFESVDNRTFVYCKNDIYETRLKLCEIEEKIINTPFVRVGKSCIINISKLKSVKSFINGRLECNMSNNEKVIVTRHYVQGLKHKLGL